ncbi:hypothetical protein J3R83DRAFT_6578 [Lanmaoa asiatica]|nr:hypothetical protein J3R83DRAFT_6578 [Lanmaoa asiatica]
MSLPPHMRADDPAAAEPARRRLLQRSSLPRFPSLPSRPSKIISLPLPLLPTDHPADDIHIHHAHHPLTPDDKDVYRWAIVYENQRGITLFSTPFYSPLSLLPSDPQPFTIPHTNNTRTPHPNLSLDNYPLPDGTWRWVSTAWMIDMRTDLGECRRMGQTQALGQAHDASLQIMPIRTTPPAIQSFLRPLLLPNSPSFNRITTYPTQLGRDGRKLELWRMWLGPCVHTHASDIKGKGKQSDSASLSSQKALEKRLSDVVHEGNPPPLGHLITILRNHGEAIIHSFVFPDSRAQFVDLVRQAGLAEDLESCLGRPCSAADVDFWSYADNLDKLLDRD